jgi:hypothetical protein
MNDITITDAIKSLAPNASWISRDGVITWNSADITQPTDAEIDAEVTRLQAVYDSQAYARTRKAKYDLLNQDEMRYDDVKNSTTTWVDAIDAIKAAHPKPEA